MLTRERLLKPSVGENMKQLENRWDYGLVQAGKGFSSTIIILLFKNTSFVTSTETVARGGRYTCLHCYFEWKYSS